MDSASSLFNFSRFQPGQWLLMCPKDQSIDFSLYGAGGWKTIASSALPESSRFSRHVLLLPDQQCAFRTRSFPFDLLASGDLDEAVSLDIELWSPFKEQCDSLYFAQVDGACWHVSVWIWPEKLTEKLMAKLPEGFVCTHVLPELAWSSACLRSTSPALLIQTSQEDQYYALVSTDGIPVAMAGVSGEVEARRYCRAYCSDVDDTSIFTTGGQVPFYCAEQAQPLKLDLPRAELLARARLPGVMDWTDPLSWKRPILTLLMIAMLWLMGDAVALHLRTASIEKELVGARAAASQVLDERDKVTSIQERLLQRYSFQRQQAKPELLISRLTEVIPKGIWLNMIQMKGRMVDLSGKGKDVARLTVLLESVEGVEKVFLVGDIRPDARTGLEIFQVRLQLENGDTR